jgi:hypothetical protein
MNQVRVQQVSLPKNDHFIEKGMRWESSVPPITKEISKLLWGRVLSVPSIYPNPCKPTQSVNP